MMILIFMIIFHVYIISFWILINYLWHIFLPLIANQYQLIDLISLFYLLRKHAMLIVVQKENEQDQTHVYETIKISFFWQWCFIEFFLIIHTFLCTKTFLQQQNEVIDVIVRKCYVLENRSFGNFYQTFFGNSYCSINICILLNQLQCFNVFKI